MLIAAIDYTAVLIALIGVATAAITGTIAIRLKRIELRAAESAKSATKSQTIAVKAAKRSRRRRRRRRPPPDHPCN